MVHPRIRITPSDAPPSGHQGHWRPVHPELLLQVLRVRGWELQHVSTGFIARDVAKLRFLKSEIHMLIFALLCRPVSTDQLGKFCPLFAPLFRAVSTSTWQVDNKPLCITTKCFKRDQEYTLASRQKSGVRRGRQLPSGPLRNSQFGATCPRGTRRSTSASTRSRRRLRSTGRRRATRQLAKVCLGFV